MVSQKKATIFIGSSFEGKKYVEAIENEFFRDDFEVIPWYRIFDDPLIVTLETLEKLKNFDFAILLLTPDDIVTYRDEEKPTARDNVIFELGLLIGYIGRDRVFPLIPEKNDIRLPTDLLGTNPFPFHYSNKYKEIIEYQQAVSFSCNNIRSKINFMGKKTLTFGQRVGGYQSGIKFHDNLFYNENENSLGFRFAYAGEGDLIDANLTLMFEHIQLIEDSKYKLSWAQLPFKGEKLPSLGLSATVYFILSQKQTYISRFLNKEKNKLFESLLQLPGRFVFYVTGTDSMNMSKQFAKKVYFPEVIVKSLPKTFGYRNARGELILESINWEDFNKLENG